MDMDMENDRAPRSATAVRTHSEDEGVVQIHDVRLPWDPSAFFCTGRALSD